MPLLINLASATIGAIIAALSRLFATRIGTWAVALLAFLGIGLATNEVVIEPLLDQARSIVESNMSSAGSMAIAWVSFLNFDKALTMLFSAVASRFAIAGTKVFLAKR